MIIIGVMPPDSLQNDSIFCENSTNKNGKASSPSQESTYVVFYTALHHAFTTSNYVPHLK